MFWKRKSPTKLERADLPSKLEASPSDGDESILIRAKSLAAALNAFEYALAELPEGNDRVQLNVAKSKLEAANEIVFGGGLSDAFAKLIDHTIHWHAWQERGDFLDYVDFEATDIVARKEVDEGNPSLVTNSIEFKFHGNDFGCILRDYGYSDFLNDQSKHGEGELFFDGRLVLRMSLVQKLNHDSMWEAVEVRALHVGEWMQDLLQISFVIERNEFAMVQRELDDDIMAVSKEITV